MAEVREATIRYTLSPQGKRFVVHRYRQRDGQAEARSVVGLYATYDKGLAGMLAQVDIDKKKKFRD